MNAPINVGATVAEFMERVLPWPGPDGSGWGNLHWALTDGKRKLWRGAPYKTSNDLVWRAGKLTQQTGSKSADIYFCTSLQSKTDTMKHGERRFAVASRHAETATATKLLFLDIDGNKPDEPDKGYANKRGAQAALAKFLADAALPPPSAIVDSGNGYHVYWISKTPLTAAQWAPYAHGLWALVQQYGLKADPVTTDIARILRVPGTFNHKSNPPKPVRLLGLGYDYDFAADLAHIVAPKVTVTVTKAAPFDLSAFKGYDLAKVCPELAAALATATDKLSDGIERYHDLPLDPTEVIKGCPHFSDAAHNNGVGHGQGLWMLTVLASTWFEDGYKWAKEFSRGYAEFDQTEAELKNMWARKMDDRRTKDVGWPSCKAFENEGCKACASCVYKGKIKSPLNLSVPQQQLSPQRAPSEEPSFVDPYAEFAGPPFPVDVLPPTLANLVAAEHRAMGADPAAIAMAALTAVAGAINAETSVRVGDSWFEKPILWTFLIGNPSTLKSPIVDKAVRPLRDIDKQRSEDWRQQYGAWKKQNKANPKSFIPPPARPARCITSDITPEKAAEILSRAPSGSLMVHDELASWMDGFERYTAGGASRGFYLQCWNGGPHNKDRVGKGRNDEDAEIFVANLALSVLGGIQPDRLAGMKDLTSDGLLQRGLPVLMRSAERGDEDYPVSNVEENYDKLIKAINAAKSEKYGFDDEARVVLSGMLDYLHKLEQVNAFSTALIGAIGKLKGYFARLCLVLEVVRKRDPDAQIVLPPSFTPEARERLKQLFDGKVDLTDSLSDGLDVRTSITCQSAEAAERIIREFLLPHIFGLYDVVVNGGQDRAKVRAIGDFILASKKDRLVPSDFTEGVRALRGTTPRELGEWVGRFSAMGWLHVQLKDEKYPVPKAWTVAPGLREHFAERRHQAQVARAEAHEVLLAGGSRRQAKGPDKSA